MAPTAEPEPTGAGPANPLAIAFAAALDTPYGPVPLTQALRVVLPHLVEAHRCRVAFKYLAAVLSEVCQATGRPPVSEDTLRGLFGRMRQGSGTVEPPFRTGRLGPTQLSESEPVPPNPSYPPRAPTQPPSTIIRSAAPPADTAMERASPAGSLSDRARRLAQAKRALRTT